MRLIDADELKSKIQKSNCNIEHLWKNVVLDVIDNCKTAYDVDEVVEQLEIYSNKDEAEQLGTIPVVELEDAFKIVKGGGIYEQQIDRENTEF